MAFNRCNKNFMGYCNGHPEWEVEPINSSYPVEQKEIKNIV